jgi:hypothetical protein
MVKEDSPKTPQIRSNLSMRGVAVGAVAPSGRLALAEQALDSNRTRESGDDSVWRMRAPHVAGVKARAAIDRKVNWISQIELSTARLVHPPNALLGH